MEGKGYLDFDLRVAKEAGGCHAKSEESPSETGNGDFRVQLVNNQER
jgi:hypothetical protein